MRNNKSTCRLPVISGQTPLPSRQVDAKNHQERVSPFVPQSAGCGPPAPGLIGVRGKFMRSRRYKGRCQGAAVAFHTFGDVRPLLDRYVLPVYADPGAPPLDIVCDTMEAALALKERIMQADLNRAE